MSKFGNDKKRIFFIVDDTCFFLPKWLDEVIESLNKNHKIIGITPLAAHGKPTFYNYIYRNLSSVGALSIVKLLIAYIVILFKKILFSLNISFTPISIGQVAKKHKIKTITTKNVNNSIYLDELKNLDPDIIISSCSQIFHKEILSLPKNGCINRHSSLLPSYAGVFPVFYAMIYNERYIGVTVHRMEEAIDAGSMLYQQKIEIDKRDTLFSLYEKTYRASSNVTLSAIAVILGKQKPHILNIVKSSYYSFPKKTDWNKFKKMGLKFI